MSTQLRRVVVTGMGGLSPLSQSSGNSIKHDWLRLVRGAIGIRNIMEETEPGDNDQVWESLPSKVAARIPRDAFQEHEDRIFSSSDHKMMSKGRERN